MAVGIPFPESNLILRAPTPEDAEAGRVYDLHAHRYVDIDGRPHVISKWQFEPDELAIVVANDGVFWFRAWCVTHPPISIEGETPFVSAGQGVAPAAEERPNAADWRNRAERAEAECAELRALIASADGERAAIVAFVRGLGECEDEELRADLDVAEIADRIERQDHRCQCMEVYGENPDCPVKHDTDGIEYGA